MRADEIKNDLEHLTPAEKERLGFLIMWALDGPEQGFLTYNRWIDLLQELHGFFKKNDVPCGGLWATKEKRL